MPPSLAPIEQLGALLGEALTARGWSLGTAESCTGGWVGKALTDCAGSSAWFVGGVIAYADAVKRELLGVRAQTLAERGAVSAEVAEQMARGARQRLACDVALATTGVAGPGGGSPAKPVGLVWFGLATPRGVESWSSCFDGDREAVRRAAVEEGLNRVLDGLSRTDS